jgi:ketosteroid isomerase-like protein
MTNTDKHNLVMELLRHQSAGDFDRMLALMTDDAVFEIPFNQEYMAGKAKIRERMAPSVARMQGLRFFDFVFRDMADPDWLMVEFKGEATVATTGRPYRQMYIALFRFEGDKVALFQEYFSTLELAIACARVEPVAAKA